jgi:hypothetical protein
VLTVDEAEPQTSATEPDAQPTTEPAPPAAEPEEDTDAETAPGVMA